MLTYELLEPVSFGDGPLQIEGEIKAGTLFVPTTNSSVVARVINKTDRWALPVEAPELESLQLSKLVRPLEVEL